MGDIFLLLIVWPILFAASFWYYSVSVIIACLLISYIKYKNKISLNIYLVALILGIGVFSLLLLPDLNNLIEADKRYKPNSTGFAPDFTSFSPLTDSLFIFGALGIYTSLFLLITSKLVIKLSKRNKI